MVDLDELIGLGPSESVLDLLLRAAVIYLVIIAAVRLSGKRGIGQASAVDFILALAVGDVIGDMAYGQESVLKAVIIIAVWIGLHALTAYLGLRFPTLEELVGGRKVVVIRDGVVMETALRHELMSREELLMLLREQGIKDPAAVRKAYLETDGRLSVFEKRPSD